MKEHAAREEQTIESGLTVEAAGKRFVVPRAVEAEGGAAIERWLRQQPGFPTKAPEAPAAPAASATPDRR